MLRIHDRAHQLNPIDAQVQEGLEGVFCEGYAATHESAAMIQAWLLQLRGDEHWLACDCRSDGDESPLLSPRQIGRDRVVLVRHGRVAHSDACPFFRLRAVGEIPPVEVSTSFLLNDLAVVPGDYEGFKRRYRQALMRILTTCGYDRLGPEDIRGHRAGTALHSQHMDVISHYRQVDLATDIALSDRLLLSEGCCHHIHGLSWLNKDLLQLGSDGVMLTTVDMVDRAAKRIRVENRRGEEEARVHEMLEVHDGGGPYWLLARVTPSESGAKIVAAYAHPMASKSLLVPVDSDMERPLLSLLCQQLRYWYTVKGIDVSLQKPLVDNALGERPDFVVQLPRSRQVLVELLAHADDDYRDLRKRAIAKTAAAPATAGIVTFTQGRGDTESWRKRLTAAVLGAVENSASAHSDGRH